jgi:anti-sigma-K factor RskA
MTSCDTHDGGADSLDNLRAVAPDPDRAERVRMRCRTQLGRSRRRAARTAVITGFAWRVLAPVVVGAFCVLYVVMLLATTLRLEGVFH